MTTRRPFIKAHYYFVALRPDAFFKFGLVLCGSRIQKGITMIRFINLGLFLLFSYSSLAMEDAKENTALNSVELSHYGSLASKNIAEDAPGPFRHLIPLELWQLIMTYCAPHEQVMLLSTSRHLYEKAYPHGLIKFILEKRFSDAKAIAFSDKMPDMLHKITDAIRKAEKHGKKDLLLPYKEDISLFAKNSEKTQFAPTVMVSKSTSNLDYLIAIETELLLLKDRPPTSTDFKTHVISYMRDRRFVAFAGFVTLGALIIGGYFISVAQIEEQAFADFMDQGQIPSFTNYDYRYYAPQPVPSCYEVCTLKFGGNFYTNPAPCNRSFCWCGTLANQSCYDTAPYDGRVRGNVSQFFEYLSSQCGLGANMSDYWPIYIQEIMNHTRNVSDPSPIFNCAPNPDGQTITCGVPTAWENSTLGHFLSIYLYKGMAQCAAQQARAQHLINYFVPSSLCYVAAVVGVLSYWHFYGFL
jgi:hypothetical protein